MPSTYAAGMPSAVEREVSTRFVIDPDEKPLHFKSVRVTLTEVTEAPSSEMVRLIVPLLAFPLISMAPVRVAPGSGPRTGTELGVGLASTGFGVGAASTGVGATGVGFGSQAVKDRISPTITSKSHSLPFLTEKPPFEFAKGAANFG